MRNWVRFVVVLGFCWPSLVFAESVELVLTYRGGDAVPKPAAEGLAVSVQNLRRASETLQLGGPAGELPPGAWRAEAVHGWWVNAREVRFEVAPRKAARVPLTLVPGCSVAAAAGGAWKADEELEILSLDFGGAVRRPYGAFKNVLVPAGKIVVSRLQKGSRIAVSRPLQCDAQTTLPLPYPAPPPAGMFSLFLQLEVPAAPPAGGRGTPPEALQPVAVGVSAKGVPRSPAASAADDYRQIAIFYDLAATEAWKLTAAHPLYLTLVEELETTDGAVLALGPVGLLARKSLAPQVEYAPKQPHRQAEMVLAYCGFEAEGRAACRDLARQNLQEGIRGYAFEGLDWGQYRLRAEIDGYVLDNLGRGVGQPSPFLKYDEAAAPSESYSISESHIFGRLLAEGEAVAGTVTLENPTNPGGKMLSSPTDDELYYHLFYFGADESIYSQPRSEKGKRDPAGISRAVPQGYSLTACDEAGFCRRFNGHSRLRGEGRLDLDLGPRVSLELTVVDEETAKKLDATILVEGEEKALLFEDGEVQWVEPAGAEGSVFRTSDGKARIPLPGAEPALVRILAEGYQPFAEEMQGESGKFLRRTARLKRKSKMGVQFTLQFPDGAPVANAFLLAIGRDGQRLYTCNAVTDRDGDADIKGNCLQGNRFVVMSPGVAISVLEEGQVVEGGKTILPRAPQPAPRLRFTRAGEPASRVFVGLRYPTFTLGPDDFLAGGASGNTLFYQSNFQGEILLRGVDPAAPVLVDVGDGRTFPLQPGSRVIEIPLD